MSKKTDVPKLMDLQNYVPRKGMIEAIRQPLYDTELVSGKDVAVDFFSTPIGMKEKTLEDTNMLLAAMLPIPVTFLIEGVALDIEDDCISWFDRGSLELYIGCANWFEMAPIKMFRRLPLPERHRLDAEQEENNYVPYRLSEPILLVPNQNFALRIRWKHGNDPERLHPVRMRAELIGVKYFET